MKRKLTISLVNVNENEVYLIVGDNSKSIKVNKKDLIIKGIDIYNSFVIDSTKEKPISFETVIDTKTIIDSEDKRNANQIKKVFDELSTELSSCLNGDESNNANPDENDENHETEDDNLPY